MYPHCNDSVVGPVIPILREHLKELRDRLARAAYERDIDSIETLLKQISIVKTTMADPSHILAGCVTERDFIIEAWRWNFAEKGLWSNGWRVHYAWAGSDNRRAPWRQTTHLAPLRSSWNDIKWWVFVAQLMVPTIKKAIKEHAHHLVDLIPRGASESTSSDEFYSIEISGPSEPEWPFEC